MMHNHPYWIINSMSFFTIMTLWWASSIITHQMKVGKIREYGPTQSHLILMITTLPAGVGVFIYPIVEAIWGDTSLLKILGETVLSLIVGVIAGNIITRGLSSTWVGILLINPLAACFSLIGIAALVIKHLP